MDISSFKYSIYISRQINNINSNRKLHQVRSEHGNTQAIICAIHQETKFSSICYPYLLVPV